MWWFIGYTAVGLCLALYTHRRGGGKVSLWFALGFLATIWPIWVIAAFISLINE